MRNNEFTKNLHWENIDGFNTLVDTYKNEEKIVAVIFDKISVDIRPWFSEFDWEDQKEIIKMIDDFMKENL